MAGHTKEFEDALGVEFEYVHSASRIDHVTSHARLPSPRALGRLNSLGSRTFRSSACGLTQISGEEAW